VKANKCSGPKLVKKTRESWEIKLIYLLAAIGFAVGLANFWCLGTLQRRFGVVTWRVVRAAGVNGDGI